MKNNLDEVSGTAFVLTDGLYNSKSAKTAHGLVRGSERFHVTCIIDPVSSGLDAGTLLDGQERGIPIYADLSSAISKTEKPQYAVIGVATPGGILPEGLIVQIRLCLKEGISVVNGLHDCLTDHDDLVSLAVENDVQLYDVRRPKKYNEYNFWSSDIFKVSTPIIAIMGTDCAVGKRTTCRLIQEGCTDIGLKATMIYTGQTGWMQGYKYGFVLDCTLNDFVSGELCHAVLSADKNESPDVILMEGQAALRNPSGPCGSEYLISANAKKVILVHEEKEYFHDEPTWGKLPSLQSEIDLVEAYGAEVIAICLNTHDITQEIATQKVANYKALYNIPVVAPIYNGISDLLPLIKKLVNEN